MDALNLPTLIASCATLIAAITGLVIAVRGQVKQEATHDAVTAQAAQITQIGANTNGQVAALRSTIDTLQEQHQQALINRIVILEGLLAKAGKRSTDECPPPTASDAGTLE